MSASTATENSSSRHKHSANYEQQNSAYGPSPIEITNEEFSRIKDAFKQEEFRKLFFEYCDEIQDPENRKQYEKDIIQLEAERGVEVTFLNPEPGFVIKTSLNGTLKCFINVAKCSIVEKPKSEISINPDNGARGLSWSIPLAQGPPRDDLDANGKRCRVFDVMFHPDALHLSEKNKGFRKCLIDTAIDAVEREFKVTLDRTNLKFPKLDFKGIARPIVTRKLSKNPIDEDAEPHPLENMYPAKPSADADTPKVLPMKSKPTTKPEFSIPKYCYKYRRDVDLSEYTNEADAKLHVTVPRELIVEIELPMLKSTAECHLDVTEKQLYLLSEKQGAKYRLNLDLPYAVHDKSGTARFDVDTRRLCITLPVKQKTIQEQREMHETVLHLNREDSGVESDIREEGSSNRNSPVDSPVEEVLSDSVDDCQTESKEEDSCIAATPLTTFLKDSIHYEFPTKINCNVLDDIMSLVLHVRNVQSESIEILKSTQNVHLKFASVGAGFYPTHYAYFLQLPEHIDFEIISADAEAWENNIVLNVRMSGSCEHLGNYLAGLNSNDLQEFSVHEKFPNTRKLRKNSTTKVDNTNQTNSSMAVEHSDCERGLEFEIKPTAQPQEQSSKLNGYSIEDDDDDIDTPVFEAKEVPKRLSKKQKKRNKKRRSFSESICDDIKAFEQHQEQLVQAREQQAQKSHFTASNEDATFAQTAENVSTSVDVPNALSQQRKQRSYSECPDSAISCSSNSTIKGILKHYSRYARPLTSISDSCSSIDDCCAYSSCSVDAGISNSLHYSNSFEGIPEEGGSAGMSESCKKTVRFNEVIKKQIFRLDSSILGQRKKNQKRRDRKLRSLQRNLSEGDSADYEENQKLMAESSSPPTEGCLKCKKNKSNKENLSKSQATKQSNKGNRSHLESESSSDIEVSKNSMMFELDM